MFNANICYFWLFSSIFLQASRKISVPLHPAKPRMMLYSRSISDEEENQDAEWKLIAHAEVAGKLWIIIIFYL